MTNKTLKYIGYLSIFSIFVILKLAGFEQTIPLTGNEPTQVWLPIAALGLSALGTVIQGAQQRKQARELEQANVRPTAQNSAEMVMNQSIAQQMSRAGLPDEVYNNQMNMIQQNMATGMRNLGSRGNLSINTNAMVRGANQAVGNLNAQDAQARAQWTQQLMNANQAVSADKRYTFQTNELNPYLQNAQNVASMRRAGTQNMFGGLSMLAQGAMMGVFGGSGGSQSSTMPQNSMFGNPLFASAKGMYS